MSDWEEYDNCNNSVQPHHKNDVSRNGERNHSSSHARWGNKERKNSNEERGKAGRNYGHKETIDIRTDCIGLIIGKGGSNIQRLQMDYNVRVTLDKEKGTVTVSGKNVTDINSALDKIKSQMDRSGNRSYSGHMNSGQHSRYRETENIFKGFHSDLNEENDVYGGEGQHRPSDNGICSHEEGNSNKNDNEDKFELIDWDAIKVRSEIARKEQLSKLPPLIKDFYQEAEEVRALSSKEIDKIRLENNNITVSRVFETESNISNQIPNPIWKFEHCFAAYPDLLAEIKKQGFEKPSPIQSQAWPILLKGEDMIGIAQTGTGKTLAFLLPAMIHTEYQSIPRSQRKGPNVLVMAPTRELALQIEKEVNKYQFRGMKAICVYGGGNRRAQITSFESGVEIIICTPGRLNDLIQAKVIDVATITYLVLDEADRMLDMGFEPQIRKILLDIRPDRQTVMTSATWPAGVRRLAQSYMCNPIQVCVGSLDLAATHTVRQVIEIVDEDDKFHTIKSFIKTMEPTDKIIVFCGKKVRADDLSSELTIDGLMCQCIHGSRDQEDREQAIADITSGEVRILIATDVASRGLDIDDITHVINYDFPRNIEEYVHRVGRTGRAGRTGTSISYITRSDWALASELISILEEAEQDIPDELFDMADRFANMKERRRDEKEKFKNNFRGQRSNGFGGYGGGGRHNRY